MPELTFCSGSCPFRSRPAEMKCACGTGHKMLPFGESFVHYEGEHWVLECLTQKLLNDKEMLEKEAEEARGAAVRIHRKLKNFREELGKLPCAICNGDLGKTGRIVGESLMCEKCWGDDDGEHDLGGEG